MARYRLKYCLKGPLNLNLKNPFLYGYDAEFTQELLKVGKKHLGPKFDFIDRYIDDILFLNNLKISEFIDLIYPCE